MGGQSIVLDFWRGDKFQRVPLSPYRIAEFAVAAKGFSVHFLINSIMPEKKLQRKFDAQEQ